MYTLGYGMCAHARVYEFLCVRACYGLYMLAGRRQVGMVMDDCFEVVRE